MIALIRARLGQAQKSRYVFVTYRLFDFWRRAPGLIPVG
jgi:hypothetical protein